MPLATIDVNKLPDLNYFHPTDCVSACWNGLRPGQTTEAELVASYQQQGFDGQSNERGVFTTYRAFSGDGSVVGTVFFKDEILYSLELSRGKLQLDTVLNQLGEPEFIKLESNLHVEQSYFDEIRLTMFYPSDGFIFNFDMRSGLQGERLSESEVSICIDGSIVPIRVELYESGSIQELLVRRDSRRDTIFSPDDISSYEETALAVMELLTSWPGVGCHTVND